MNTKTMCLKSFSAYDLGNTPIHQARSYCPLGNLYLKLEGENPNGSIKDRTAYYLVNDLLRSDKLKPGVQLVESSSGNLGLAISHFAREIGVRFLCLVDPTIAPRKMDELKEYEVEFHVVVLGDHPDYRTARIQMARDLDQHENWIWTNQYDNMSNYQAHYDTTGPEIWRQFQKKIHYLVCSVGTGGTICGTGQFLKECDPSIRLVAVEPFGSTIFGGKPGKYLSAGAGMRHPSGIFKSHGEVVDYFCKIDDRDAICECRTMFDSENIKVGITTGAVLVVARQLANRYPGKNILAISPDGGEMYSDLVDHMIHSHYYVRPKVALTEYIPE